MNCPSCKTVSLSMSERNGIEIDFCPECRGVWLDRGELDKIIEKNSILMNPPITQIEQPNSRPNLFGQLRDRQYQYKRKKSFLEEIFD